MPIAIPAPMLRAFGRCLMLHLLSCVHSLLPRLGRTTQYRVRGERASPLGSADAEGTTYFCLRGLFRPWWMSMWQGRQTTRILRRRAAMTCIHRDLAP